jgi:AcrR family transcriptional regulator
MGTSGIRSDEPNGRERILQAALHRFATNGHASTPLRTIAQEAHVSATLIAHHFGNKQRLREAVERRIVERFEQAAAAAAADHADFAGETALGALARRIGDLMASQPDVREYLRRVTVVEPTAEGMLLLQSLLTLARNLVPKPRHGASGPESADRSLQFLLLALGPALLGPALQRCMPDVFDESATSDFLARQIDAASSSGRLS